ncbi:MAG: IS3 family transposase, partial [Candidatus Microthrix parvicella]
VAEYIELWYNRERLHSALEYQTPSEVREAYQKPVAA